MAAGDQWLIDVGHDAGALDDDKRMTNSLELAASLGGSDLEPDEVLEFPPLRRRSRAELVERVALLRQLAADRATLPAWAGELPVLRVPGVRRLALRLYNLASRELRNLAGLTAETLELLAAELWVDEFDDG